MRNVSWPYTRRAALLLGIAIWLAAGAALAIANAAEGWPDAHTGAWLPLIVIALGLVPAALVVLDGLRASRASINLRWFSVDFSQATVIQQSVGIPENIAAPGEPVTDSGGRHIRDALKKSPQNEIVIIDLKNGHAWWVTRLLVLAAAAADAGAPRAFVFLATREETRARGFVGWAKPKGRPRGDPRRPRRV
jgi:hypothetical protein